MAPTSLPIRCGHIEAFGWKRDVTRDRGDARCWLAPDGTPAWSEGEMRDRNSCWGPLPPIRIYYPFAVEFADGSIRIAG